MTRTNILRYYFAQIPDACPHGFKMLVIAEVLDYKGRRVIEGLRVERGISIRIGFIFFPLMELQP